MHGDARGSVDKDHNKMLTPFLPPDVDRLANEVALMRGDGVRLDAQARCL